jgi:K+-sensing histidine kinase KdpD
MGLTIVQSIIETDGRNIRTENLPHRGARFFFRVPAARKPQTRAA